MSKSKTTTNTWLIILIIILILIIYIASLGQVRVNNLKIADELSESREKAKHRHQKLEVLIKKQVELKSILDRKFKQIYLGVRIILVSIWIGLAISLYLVSLIENVGDFLTYSQFTVLLLVTLHFITFGSLRNVNEFIDSIKRRTENWVYGKYVDIETKIESNKKEQEKLLSGNETPEVSVTNETNYASAPSVGQA